MKYIWEPSDFKDGWGLMAERGEELVVISGHRATSLRDGHSWKYCNAEDMARSFNESGYIPVLAPVNPSVVIRKAMKDNFGYGDIHG